jgi:hypothetical protein
MSPTDSTWLPRPEGSPELRTDLLEQCRRAWESLRDFRTRRARSRDYFRNRPREKMVDPATGKYIDEDEYIRSEGRIPYKMNHIRDVVMNLKGQFRQNKSDRSAYGRNREDNEAAEMMTEGLRYVCDVNETEELDADQFVESLVSGMFGYKTIYNWHDRLQRDEVRVDPVDTTRFFFTPGTSDRRMDDIDLIGEILDMTFQELCANFATTPEDEEKLKRFYSQSRDPDWTTLTTRGFEAVDILDFYTSPDPAKCRVITAWKKEFAWQTFLYDPRTATYDQSDVSEDEVRQLNQQRIMEAAETGEIADLVQLDKRFAPLWRAYFMTPNGEVLFKKACPYWHMGHPYTVGFSGFFDGEIWGLIEDIIDPQRLVNRLTTAIDYMFASSAKGVLLIDEDAIPEGMTLQEFADEWTKFNGVIRFKWKQGSPKPEQITHNAVPEGLFKWLASMVTNIREISGVNSATLGMDPKAGMPAALYEQQVIQAQSTNRDYFDTIFAVRRRRDLMICQTIAQFWQDKRMLPTQTRRPDNTRAVEFDPARVRDIEWNIVISDMPHTAAARQEMEGFMQKLLDTNRLTFRQYLQESANPKADAILNLIEKTNPLMADQQIGPEQMTMLKAQVQQDAAAGDPDAAAYLAQAQ